MHTVVKILGKALMIFLVSAIILGYICVQYGIVGAKQAGLVVEKLSNPDFHYSPWIYVLYAHIITGGIALGVGLFQMLRKPKNGRSPLHRWLGKIYVSCILVSGIVNIYLSLFASGGWITQTGFFLLDGIWMATTLTAVNRIRSKQILAHQQWMLRSYALTFSGVTLRIWLPLLMIPYEFESAYPIAAWLAWVPNLLLIEWVIRRKASRTTALMGQKAIGN
ncbi:DUF2306 domain-containing protein [Paenibacillus alginolyticus]|uniref:DUF2306 domain-containing protein n=1 Tax=Paenibacillus alginolyticus TaxID=59839 RepID=A0ABT4G9D4_9BACL|nr:DUF2306 domain-containing protein [Paenibacillus alginolyticus]MCY9669716.1 DUF2306 domain-containing protein [Paenibacillus alginolyticus]MCY9692789.1 DUF2306 domain-containing protein [Paenibacillus alginolyticus]MEC0146110.1 DUF2306 domain-containing protein [Paenibacillus alginolyticus]